MKDLCQKWKIKVLSSIFGTSLHLDDVKLAELSNNLVLPLNASITELLHCTLSCGALVQCIVIGPVCLCLWVGGWVCYHDNSKFRALIFIKLGL